MSVDYTLGDLLAEPSLNLHMVTGPRDALSTPLWGAHSIEMDNPAQWLDPGWLMLTMGIRLRHKPAEQRRLVADLQELGASALGFGVGVAFKAVPTALLEEAAAREFPVVMVPIDTQFQQISRAVFQATVSTEAQTYARLTSLQRNLLRAFADQDPVDSTLRRLSRLSNSTVAVVGFDGTAHASTGSLPFDRIAEALIDRPMISAPQYVADWEILSAPLSSWRGNRSVALVLASRSNATSPKFGRTILDVAVPIVEALGKLTVANRRHDQALSKALVDTALGKKLSAVEKLQFEDHLRSSGMDLHDGFNCVVIRGVDPESVVLDSLEGALSGPKRRFPAVYSRRRDHMVLIVPGQHAVVAEIKSLFGTQNFEQVRTGIGRSVDSAHDLTVSYRDANIVLRYLEQEDVGIALTFDELDLASQLFAEVSADRVALKVKRIVDLLVENPIQHEALRAYFATCQDVQAAAKSIFIHPNTLRYRLERFELALGRSLRDPAIIASLHYVLSLMQVRSVAGPAPLNADIA